MRLVIDLWIILLLLKLRMLVLFQGAHEIAVVIRASARLGAASEVVVMHMRHVMVVVHHSRVLNGQTTVEHSLHRASMGSPSWMAKFRGLRRGSGVELLGR